MTDATTLDPRLSEFLVIGNNHGWAKHADRNAAIRNMHRSGEGKATEYHVYHATPSTTVNDMGDIVRPLGDPAPVKQATNIKDGAYMRAKA